LMSRLSVPGWKGNLCCKYASGGNEQRTPSQALHFSSIVMIPTRRLPVVRLMIKGNRSTRSWGSPERTRVARQNQAKECHTQHTFRHITTQSQAKKKPSCSGRPVSCGGPSGCLPAVLPLELLNTPSRINEQFLAGEERMRSRAYFDFDQGIFFAIFPLDRFLGCQRRPCQHLEITGCSVENHFSVLRMTVLYHLCTLRIKRECKDNYIAGISKVGFPYFWPADGPSAVYANLLKMRYFGFFLAGISTVALGQSNYAPLNEDYYHQLDRYEVKAGRLFDEGFTSAKPYKRSDIIRFLDTAAALGVFESQGDVFNDTYFRNDSWEWARTETNDSRKPWFNALYKKKSDLFYVDEPDFDLHVNPVLYLGAGTDSRLDEPIFFNTRGVEVRGMVDRKVGFYTYFADNQARLPSYVQEYQSQYWVIPHEGFWKRFGDGAVDFLQARGYITFDATRHINLQLGYDRFFSGNGIRSLVLSDFPPPAFFLKGAVKVWKLNYVFSLSQIKAEAPGSANGSSSNFLGNANKFTAFHHLSVNIGSKVNIGLFESIIFSPDDAIGTGDFELSYLNPIIFFRAIEQQNGSSDNVLLGLDFKVNAIRKFSVYGQFVLDEFLLENIRQG